MSSTTTAGAGRRMSAEDRTEEQEGSGGDFGGGVCRGVCRGVDSDGAGNAWDVCVVFDESVTMNSLRWPHILLLHYASFY